MKICDGCIEEFEAGIEYQENGLFLATTLDCEFWENGHFYLIMCDSKGHIKVW